MQTVHMVCKEKFVNLENEHQTFIAVHKSLSLVSVPCEMNPVYGFHHFRLPSTTMPPKLLFLSGFRIKTMHGFPFLPICATCLSHSVLIDLFILLIFCKEYTSLIPLWYNFLQCSVTLPLIDSYIFLSLLFSSTQSELFSHGLVTEYLCIHATSQKGKDLNCTTVEPWNIRIYTFLKL